MSPTRAHRNYKPSHQPHQRPGLSEKHLAYFNECGPNVSLLHLEPGASTEKGALGCYQVRWVIEGEVFVVSPQYLPHGVVKAELYDQLRDFLRASGSSWRILSEVSVELSNDRSAELSLQKGDAVFVAPRRARVFGPAPEYSI